jgi:hypothetical protein
MAERLFLQIVTLLSLTVAVLALGFALTRGGYVHLTPLRATLLAPGAASLERT